MKKILLPLMAVAAMLTACDEEQYEAPQIQKGVTFTVPDFIEEAGTRVAVTIDNSGANFTWTEGDTLGVFPSNGYQTAFPISGGAGTNTAVFDGADWALRPNASYAAYYPFVPSMQIDKKAIPVSYNGQVQDGNGSTAHIGDYDYLAAKYNTVSASGDVNFTLNHLGCLVRFQLTMPEADTYTSMTLSCEGSMLTTAGKFDLTAATPALTVKSQDESISLALENVATAEANQVLTLYMMLPPMDLSGKNLSIKVSGEKDYEATVAGKDMKAGSIYGYTNSMALSSAHKYVDLGLSVKWATCNVGATKPEEYGDYFAWGETEPYYTEGHSQDSPCSNWKSGKCGYNWSSYKYCNNGDWTGVTKYTYPDGNTDGIWYSGSSFVGDNKTVLEAADDPAVQNWGGDWRMPTLEEMKELIDKCTWTRTTQNGVNGHNVVGPNGNSIFLPAAGYRDGSSLSYAGSYGYYWSSSLATTGATFAYYLFFHSNYYDWRDDYGIRYHGQSVRPVCPNPDFIRATSIQITAEKTQLAPSETLQLSATIAPSDATNAFVTWSSSKPSVATVSADGLVTAFDAGTATITAYARDGSGVKGEYQITVTGPALMHNGHEYVDLGITDDNGNPIYWATCNVGATKPEEYGDYFAWGETKAYGEEDTSNASNYSYQGSYTKTYYHWNTYKWSNNGEWTGKTKYTYPDGKTSGIWYRGSSFIGDNKTVLEAADDAATQNWGGDWRMPTDAELTLLHNNCYWEWTTNYKSTNKAGYIVYKAKSESDKGKKSFPSLSASYSVSDTHIFLPSAGFRSHDYLSDGSSGFYWSSSLYTSGSDYAYSLYFYSSDVYRGSYTQFYGLSVRPVCQ